MTPQEELAHAREKMKQQHRELLKFRAFVDYLVPPLLDEKKALTRTALSVIDRPIHDVRRFYEALPEVKE